MKNNMSLQTKGYVDQIAARTGMKPEWFLTPPMELFTAHTKKLIDHIRTVWNEVVAPNPPASIFVHGDYDVDGITSGEIWLKTLRQVLPDAQIEIYLPKRESGYGITPDSIDKLNELKPELVITVDCGTNDVLLHEHARQNPQTRYLVFDHHIIDKQLVSNAPENMTIINGHDFRGIELCSAGISFCMAIALLDSKIYENGDLVGLGAFGTVADLTPLNNPANFAITKLGLGYLNKRQPSWAYNLNGNEKFYAYSFGFIMGPRINAISRIGESPMIALKALEGDIEAVNLLNQANNQRQDDVKTICDRVMPTLLDDDSPVIFIEVEDALPGYVGLIASKLVELFDKPALVACPAGDTMVGSARSVKGVHLVDDILKKAKKHLLRFGGHEMAAGFSYEPDKFEEIKKGFGKLKLNPETKEKEALPVSLQNDDIRGAAMATYLTEPHGLGNPTPEYVAKDVYIDRILPLKDGQYTTIIFKENPTHGKEGFARISFWNSYFTVTEILEDWNMSEPVTVYFNAKYDPTSQWPVSLTMNELHQGEKVLSKKTLMLYEMRKAVE